MKLLRILPVFLLMACAPYQTLDELKAEAKVSGDWTKVNKRLERLEKKEGSANCPSDKTEICDDWGCRCLTKRQLPMVIGQ